MDKTQGTCPTGFEPFSDAEGRFLVFGDASQNLTISRTSPAIPATGSQSNIGEHSHNLANVSLVTGATCITGMVVIQNCNTKGGAATSGTYAMMQSKQMTASRIPIPYVQLIACRVTDNGNNNVLPHPDAVFFYDGNTCPARFREATSRQDNPKYANIVGRVIWTGLTGTPGSPWGDEPFRHAVSAVAASDPGINSHTHTAGVSNYKFPGSYFQQSKRCP
jgi:hypothetical protein